MDPGAAGQRPPLFRDRAEAGRRLAEAISARAPEVNVVYGLARGGVPVAAEVARVHGVELDAVAVRKIGHPLQPELALGAVAANGPPVVRLAGREDRVLEASIRDLVELRRTEAAELDARLHARADPIDPRGRVCVLVDDGLATGSTMVAACRWARAAGADGVVVGVPVSSVDGARELREEADAVVCVVEALHFRAVSVWYERFDQVPEAEVERLLAASRGG